jgi:LPXTG-site transpeptidase (sortase) family protein
MRDFSLLLLSLTALVLGALVLFHRPNLPASVPLGVIDEVQTSVSVATPPPETRLPAPTATAVPRSNAPVARLRIDKIGVDANIVMLGIDRDGYMEAPKEPLDVGWYQFSAHPSFGGNAVFAGHVDSARIGPAIFWRLRQVAEGDEIQVSLEDGTTYRYRVVSARSFSSGDAPVEEIIGPTEKDSITVITCDGTFNTRSHEYDRRLVVRAEKVAESRS